MKNILTISALLAAGLLLGACSKDSQPESAPAAPATTLKAPAATTHPMTPSTTPPQAQPAPAATAAGYQIPPFPISNVALCDHYASEARRCLNQNGTDEQRHAYDSEIRNLLKQVTPKDGEPVNEWLTQGCRRGLELLARKFKSCKVQMQ